MSRILVIVVACIMASVWVVADVSVAQDIKGSNERSEGEVTIKAVSPALPDVTPSFTRKKNRIGTSISIPVAAFTNDGGNPTGYYKFFGSGYMVGTVDSGCCLTAPVNFPKNARRITDILVYAWDNTASAIEWFDFYRFNLVTGVNELIGQVTTTDSAGIEAYEITPSDPDQFKLKDGYTYSITTCVRPGINVYGVEIFYAN